MFSIDAYPDLYSKGAALLHSIARNPALVNGNKRTAWAAARVFPGVNGVFLPEAFDADRAEQFMNEIATKDDDLHLVVLSLAWKASEAASLLEQTVAAVNSALQRARKTLAARRGPALMSVTDPQHSELLDKYMEAFESYDITRLVTLLREDAVLSIPPFDLWLSGPSEMAAWFVGKGIVCKDSRLIPVMVNGTAGFGAYHRVAPGLWEPFSIQVIETRDNLILAQHNFLYPEMFGSLGLPDRIDER